MKKKLIQAAIAATLISALTVSPVFATPTVEDMRGDKEAAEGEVSALQKELTSTLEKIGSMEEELEDKQKEIEKASEDLEEASHQQTEQYKSMKLRIKYMYEFGGVDVLQAFLTAESFSDLLNKVEYVQNVHQYDRDKLDEFIETTNKITKLEKSLQKEAKSLEKTQTELEAEESELSATIENKQSQIAKLDEDIKQAVREREAAKLRAEEERRQAEEEAARERERSEREVQERAEEAQEQETEPEEEQPDQEETPSEPATERPVESENSGGDKTEQKPEAPSQNSDGWAVVAYARQFLGYPYKYGGNSLTNGTDCSGFTQQIYAHFGISLGRTDAAQASAGVEVSLADAQAGDLVVYYGHVGIYNGSGGLIHASSPSVGIIESSSCTYRAIRSVRRVL